MFLYFSAITLKSYSTILIKFPYSFQWIQGGGCKKSTQEYSALDEAHTSTGTNRRGTETNTSRSERKYDQSLK